MGKKKKSSKVPKKLFGFKLSKGTRKDLGKLFKLVTHPDSHSLVMSGLGALSALLAERVAKHHEEGEQEAPRPATAH